MTLEGAISIASLYLALVSLLSTFFYIQLGQWLNGIRGTEAKWSQVSVPGKKTELYEKRLECYYEAVQYFSVWTGLGWLGVTAFLVMVGVFLEVLRDSLQRTDAAYIRFYVSIPGYIFLGLYVILSSIMLVTGYWKAGRIKKDALKSL